MKTRIYFGAILFAGAIFFSLKSHAQVCACNCVPVMNTSVINNAPAHGCNGTLAVQISDCQVIGGNGTIHRNEGNFADIPIVPVQQLQFQVPAGHYVITFNYNAFNFCGCPGAPPVNGQLQQQLEVTEPECNLTLATNTTPSNSVSNPNGSIHVVVTGTTCGTGTIEVVDPTGAGTSYQINNNSEMNINNLSAGTYEIKYYYLNPAGVHNCEILVTDTVGCAHTILNCPGDFSVPNDMGLCGAEVDWTPPTLECGCTYTVTSNPDPYENFQVGDSIHVKYDFHLETGVNDSCGFYIMVHDLEGPVIDGPAQIDEIVNVDYGVFDDCGAFIDFENEFTVTDNCPGNIDKSFSIPSGSFFEKGITTVVLSATDIHGNTSSRNFNVNVIDITPPTLVVPANIFKNNHPGLCKASILYADIGAIATDNCQGNVDISYNFNSGQFISNGGTVQVTATDVEGNQTTATVTINVIDIDTPVVTFCPADIHVSNDPGDPGPCGAIVNYFLPTATDNCTNPLLPVLAPGSLPPGALFPVGNNLVSYTFTDAAGNVATCNFKIRVDDVDPPFFIGANIIVPNDPGLCSALINLGAPGVGDNCGVLVGPVGPGPGFIVFPVGTTPLNYSATDINFNVGFATFYVTVLDIEKPQFNNCPLNIVTNNPVVYWTEPAASDNCNDSVIQTHHPGDVFPPGITEVMYIAVDPSGNRDTCKFTVTVNCGAAITPGGNVTICSGTNLTMQANTGTGSTYQWKKNGYNISGATNSSYTTNKAASYTVVVTSASCTATSAATVITVSSSPSATITPSGNVTVCPGVAVTFQSNTGTGLTYQWTNPSGIIAGATNSSYTTSSKGSYKVIVTNSNGCSKTSMGDKLMNYAVASVKITSSGPLYICSSGSVTLNAKVVSGYTYQWYKNDVVIAGASGSSYVATVAGTYKYQATTPNGCTNVSASKTVTGCRFEDAFVDSPVASSLNLYPNPSDGIFILDVQLNNHFSGNATVEIMNSIGQIIKQEVVEVNDGVFAHTIHLQNNVSAGMYFVKVMAGNQMLKSQLMITR